MTLMALVLAGRRYVLIAVLILCLLFLIAQYGVYSDWRVTDVFDRPKSSKPSSTTTTSPSSSTQPIGEWDFNVGRDGDNYSLDDKQCAAAFPKLFEEIEKSVATRKKNLITFEEFDSWKVTDGMVRAMVYDGELYLINFEDMGNTFSRALASLHSLHRALVAAPDRKSLPNIEFEFTTEDFADGERVIWAYSKKEGDDPVWLMPDFGYWSWPEVKAGPYHGVRRQIAAVDDGAVINGLARPGLNFSDKDRRLIWRGNVDTGPEVRGKLMEVTKEKTWADVKALNWHNKEDIKANLLPLEDHCRYMFVAHTEGRSYSGRGKYLQNCRSVFVAHQLVWKEAHHGALESSGPNANYVEVKRDFSDLEEKMEYLLTHTDEAKRIADNSVRIFRDRYLTPAAEACYWRRLIEAWRSVCNFEPRFYSDTEGKKLRGVPFESFVLTGALE